MRYSLNTHEGNEICSANVFVREDESEQYIIDVETTVNLKEYSDLFINYGAKSGWNIEDMGEVADKFVHLSKLKEWFWGPYLSNHKENKPYLFMDVVGHINAFYKKAAKDFNLVVIRPGK